MNRSSTKKECMHFSDLLHQITLYQTTNFWTGPNLKHLQTYKINVTEKLKIVLGREENIMGKGENAGYQHFLLFP